MTDAQHYAALAEKARQETIREYYEIHQKHVVGWLYKGATKEPCPCVNCYKSRRAL